jgi:hypothetical protein
MLGVTIAFTLGGAHQVVERPAHPALGEGIPELDRLGGHRERLVEHRRVPESRR